MLIAGIYLLSIALFLNVYVKNKPKKYNSDKNYSIKFINYKKQRVSLLQMLRKCDEEDKEFYRAITKNDLENSLEEFHDSVQAKANTLQQLGVPVEMICDSQKIHFEKLKSRGWELK